MHKRLKILYSRYFSANVPLRARFFYTFSLAGVVVGGLSVLATVCYGMPDAAVWACALCAFAILCVTLYGYLSQKIDVASVLMLLIFNCVLLPFAYFSNGGMQGGTAFYFVLGLFMCVPLLKNKQRLPVFAVSLLALCLTILVAWRYPAYVAAIPAEAAKLDILTSLVLVGVLSFFAALLQDAEYAREQFKVRRVNRDLSIAADRLRRQSMIDPLTGLFNKAAAEKICTEYLERRETTEGCVLLVLDLDEFKRVNDSLGHQVGDAVLRAVGECLLSMFREDDVLGRIGGDEFLVLMPQNESCALVERKAELLRERMCSLTVSRVGRAVACSIGAAVCADAKISYRELFRTADAALYEAKGSKACCVVHKVERI